MLKRIKTIDLPPLSGEIITSTFLMTQCVEKDGNKSTRLQLMLDDASGSVTGFVWPEHRANIPVITTPSVVQVTGKVQIFNGKSQLNVQQLSVVSHEAVETGAVLLPLRLCPEAALTAFQQLIELEQSLPEPLRGFLKRVLLDPAIGVPLLRCRASDAHHHPFIGGLLAHSMEMMEPASRVVRIKFPEQPLHEHLACLGLLLHDIGKLNTVGEIRRPEFASILKHETHSLLLLTPHLDWLKVQDPSLAVTLTYLLEYIATPAPARTRPKYLLAEIVTMFDQLSAALDCEKRFNDWIAGSKKSKSKISANDASFTSVA